MMHFDAPLLLLSQAHQSFMIYIQACRGILEVCCSHPGDYTNSLLPTLGDDALTPVIGFVLVSSTCALMLYLIRNITVRVFCIT